ncbi:aldehyde dehydrogenase family protein [Burkholderia sp. B21-005]|uniref:aldehyde dehydrogenase family protein n=1 Tax=Burkholderia sp. B21-005 TaxID=2890406 RepID=UPI001E39760F|nr:aldehyde dehydrogenase family protein [Burkholderia sp. B21-005]
MKPERRHVGIFYRAGRAHVEHQPVGVVGVMAPWNYPFVGRLHQAHAAAAPRATSDHSPSRTSRR